MNSKTEKDDQSLKVLTRLGDGLMRTRKRETIAMRAATEAPSGLPAKRKQRVTKDMKMKGLRMGFSLSDVVIILIKIALVNDQSWLGIDGCRLT